MKRRGFLQGLFGAAIAAPVLAKSVSESFPKKLIEDPIEPLPEVEPYYAEAGFDCGSSYCYTAGTPLENLRIAEYIKKK